MGNPYAANAATFLIQVVFGLYILALLLRFLLAWVRADFYNPLSQFLVRVTNPVIIPVRRIVPAVGRIDTTSVLLLFLLECLQYALIALARGAPVPLPGLPLIAIAGLLDLTIQVFVVSILVQVVLSWISPGVYNPLVSLLYSLNEPLLGPARRLLPPMGGLDLSPLVVLVLLELTSILLVAPLHDLGFGLGG